MLHKHGKWIFTVLCILFLFACDNTTTQKEDTKKHQASTEIIEQSIAAHQSIDVFEYSLLEDNDGNRNQLGMIVDLKNEEGNISWENDSLIIYFSKDHVMLQQEDGKVEETTFERNLESLIQKTQTLQNPLQEMVTIDEKVIDYFDMKETADTYMLTFDGPDGLQQKLGAYFLHLYPENASDTSAPDENKPVIKELDFTIELDKDSALIKKMDQKVTYTFFEKEHDTHLEYSYGKYNEPEYIQKIELADQASNNLDEATAQTLKTNGSRYVEALIEATVFQNEAGFIEIAPDTMTEKDKEKEVAFHKEYLRQVFTENTKNNIEGYDISEAAFEQLMDAYLSALSITKYEMKDVEITSEEDIIVTISVEGIDEAEVYANTASDVKRIVKKEKLNQKEAVAKNIDILQDHFNAVDSTVAPVEVQVHVRIDDGEYYVSNPNEFLAGFSQHEK